MEKKFKLSVIICTHNPKLKILNRTIEALKHQTLPREEWELLIVDNNSDFPVHNLVDISWNQSGRCISEENQGLTSARLRGMKEAKADLLLFVDDDNFLRNDYLEILIHTMNSMPLLGVLGAGKMLPEFEVAPSGEKLSFLRSLAIRNEERAHFSNAVSYHRAIPFGAGLCIRNSIARAYAKSCASRPLATSLDRNGDILLSGGDIDLALHACREGYLAGVLPELELIHFIPKERLDPNYLVKIAAGHAASGYLLSQLWEFEEYPQNPVLKWARYWKKRLKAKGLSRKIVIAEYKAEKEARLRWKKDFA